MQQLTISLLSALALSPAGTLALYGGMTLERVHFQPMARDIIYAQLTNINTMNYMNLSEVYTRVIECNQLVAALKNEMGARLNESVPPPRHHCFIAERDLNHLPVINQANSTQGLRCDQYMLARFPSAMRRAAQYERLNFQNQEGRTMLRVMSIVEDIQRALTSLTGLVVNGTSEMARSDSEACGMYTVMSEPEEEEEEEEQEARSPFVPLKNDPTDSAFFDRRKRQAEATPTATTPTRCTTIEDAGDQFIYITELWIALYYLELDLKQKRNCFQDQ